MYMNTIKNLQVISDFLLHRLQPTGSIHHLPWSVLWRACNLT
jgi:hypothetical protein